MPINMERVHEQELNTASVHLLFMKHRLKADGKDTSAAKFVHLIFDITCIRCRWVPMEQFDITLEVQEDEGY